MTKKEDKLLTMDEFKKSTEEIPEHFPPDVKKVIEGLTKMQEMFTVMLQVYAHQARDTKAKYDAYVKAGFTPDQALILVNK
jgi:hypothetical protein